MPKRTPRELLAAAWHALAKMADKEIEKGKLRDELTDGALYELAGHVEVRIEGEAVRQRFCGPLTVGHAQTTATSATPKLPEVVAAILARLTKPKRCALCQELVEGFRAAGHVLPAPDSAIVAQAEQLLADLRTEKQIEKRGPVSCKYELQP